MRLGIKPAEESLPAAQQIETNVSRLFKSVSDKGREASEMVRGGGIGITGMISSLAQNGLSYELQKKKGCRS